MLWGNRDEAVEVELYGGPLDGEMALVGPKDVTVGITKTFGNGLRSFVYRRNHHGKWVYAGDARPDPR